MSKPFSPSIITANHLRNGKVLYFTATDDWCHEHARAEWLSDATQATERLSRAQQDSHIVVDPYLAEAHLNAAGLPEPSHFREQFRTRGPSNYFHGKQAD
jgi:hypothetical protein